MKEKTLIKSTIELQYQKKKKEKLILRGAQPSPRLQEEKKNCHSLNLCWLLVAMTYTKLEQLPTLAKDAHPPPPNLQTSVGWV